MGPSEGDGGFPKGTDSDLGGKHSGGQAAGQGRPSGPQMSQLGLNLPGPPGVNWLTFSGREVRARNLS